MPPPKRTPSRLTQPTHTVGFRLDTRTLRRLETEAGRLNMSPGEYARKLVIDALEDHVRARLLEETGQTREEVRKLRADLATALEVVLLNVTEVDNESVSAWVSQNLRR